MSYIKTDRRDAERAVFKTGPRFVHLLTAVIMWMRTYRNIFVWRVHTFRNWLFTTVSRKEFTSLELFLTVGPRQLNTPSILLCFNLIHEQQPTEPFTAAVARARCSPRHLAHGTWDFTDTCCRRRNGPLSLSTNSWSCPPVSLYSPRLQTLLGHQKDFYCHLAV